MSAESVMEVEGEIEEYNSIWLPQEVVDAEHGFLHFWKADQAALSQLQTPTEVPVFFPFLDPFSSGGDLSSAPVMFLSETRWNTLRATIKDKQFQNWPKISRDNRNLGVTLDDGTSGGFARFREETPHGRFGSSSSVTDSSAYWVDSFDYQFELGQEQADKVEEALGKKRAPWKRVNGLHWKRRRADNPGAWKAGSGVDERNFEPRNDGVGFVYDGWGGEAPDPAETYVKLCPFSSGHNTGEAELLLLADPAARNRGVTADEMYVPNSVMTRLRAGTYPFEQRSYAVALRDAAGEVQYVQAEKGGLTTRREFWENAYWNGLTRTEWKVARWRNVKDLELCFVVASLRTTVEELTAVIKEAMTDTIIPIKQTARVVQRKDKPTEFNRYVSSSSFSSPSPFLTNKNE
jgi:hypothetical protein